MSRAIPAGPFDAIVIGSGIGGLGTAALLALEGWRVLVLERHWVAGGATQTFRRGPFEWAVGLHYLGKVHDSGDMLRRLFDRVSRGELQWAKLPDVYDSVIFDDASFGIAAGADAYIESLGVAFPGHRDRIARYVKLVRWTARAGVLRFGARLLSPRLRRVLEPMLGAPFAKVARRRTGEVLREVLGDEQLVAVVAGRWGNYGLPPGQSSFGIHALVDDFYLDGGNYPVGGAAALARSIVPTIEAAGGAVVTGAAVHEIIVVNRRAVGVRLEDGRELFAKAIISNVDRVGTLHRLLPEAHRPAPNPALRCSGGHLGLYLGLRGTASELGLDGANRWVCASRDHDAAFAAHDASLRARFPLVYIASGSAKDPTWASRHPDTSTLTAIVPAKHEDFSRWAREPWRRRGPAYDALKSELAERMREVVLRHVPSIAGRIAHEELSTPLTMQSFLGREDGAIYGLDHTPERLLSPQLGPRSPLANLFLCGADTLTVGVGSSLLSAMFTASAVSGRNLFVRLYVGHSRSFAAAPRLLLDAPPTARQNGEFR